MPFNILVAEDDMDLGKGLRMVFESEGFKVTTVSTGEEAISLFQNNNYDLTLMDVKLPGMDGVEAFINILELKPEAKVVIMTAYKIDTLLAEVEDRGAVSILRKPFEIGQVLELIAKLQADREFG